MADGPYLDFGDWRIDFPDRGHRAFLACGDLRATSTIAPPAREPGIWLVRTGSGLSVILAEDVAVTRDGVAVTGIAVLHHGERLEFADHLCHHHEVDRRTLAPANRLVGQRCPQCHRTFAAGDEVLRCPLCRAGYCLDCWTMLANQRCYSRGCSFAPGPVTP